MARTKSYSADFKVCAALEALHRDATLAQLATRYEIHLKSWTIGTTE